MDEFSGNLLADRLAAHTIVGIDSAIFIYQLEAHPIYYPLADRVLSGIAAHHYRGITSVITLMELTVHPWRANMEMIAREYEALLVHFPNLQLIDVNREIARRAAQLRARFALRPADALQVAAALENGATAFVTNDQALNRVVDIVDVIVLLEFVQG